MSVKEITTEDSRKMNNTEGIIFQGCGGDPQEWIDGINEELTKSDILKTAQNLTEQASFRMTD